MGRANCRHHDCSQYQMTRSLTSPSNMDRRAACPGSARMEEGLPDENTLESREGSDLHSFMAHPEYDRSFLKQHLQDLLAAADELDQRMFQTIINFERIRASEEYVEQRELEIEWAGITGHMDLRRRYPKRGLTIIRDVKFGFLVVPPAELNLQVRSYASMAEDEVVYVGITQPRAPFNSRITLARYDKADVWKAQREIRDIDAKTKPKDAPLHAGEHCRFCRARAICPEILQAVQRGIAPMDVVTSFPAELSKPAKLGRIEALLAQRSDEELGRMIDAYALVQFIYEPMMDEARRRIDHGGMTDWKVSKAMERRKIVNSQRAIALLSLAGMSREDILECANLSLTKLEEKLNHGKLRTGQVITGAKDAREFTTRVLTSVLELEIGKPRVMKK